MAIFNSFSDILPDPIYKITDAGSLDQTSGSAGPGFASMRLRSVKESQVSRTKSGRGIHRGPDSQNWEIDITYHQMLRSQFDPVDAFLLSRGRLLPFFVVLPQHSKPKDPVFAAYAAANSITVNGAHNAGSSVLNIKSATTISGDPKPKDLITISDPANANHLKAYMITRVETAALYQAGTTAPTTAQRRIHISPPLERNTADNSVVNFISPKIRVIPKGDVQEYDLNTDNLYNFSLSLEEIQP